MSAQIYWEDQLEEAIENLFKFYHKGGGKPLTREKAFGALNKKISEITDDLQKRVPND